MKVNCGNCKAEYNLDPAKVPAQGGVFKCKSCGTKVQIPAQGAAKGAAAPAAAPAATPAAPVPPKPPPARPAAPEAIALAGSDERPNADGPGKATRPAAPIPLAGSDATRVDVPPARPDAPIPLAGSDATQVDAPMPLASNSAAIPLAGSDADNDVTRPNFPMPPASSGTRPPAPIALATDDADDPIPLASRNAARSAGPIPLAGSNATRSDDPIPLASSSATPSDKPIPLASSSATTSDKPIPLASSSATPSDKPIPLTSSSATTSDEPIPLASSNATPSDEPIPLASSSATSPAGPIPLASSNATPSAGPIPLAGSNATPSAGPIPLAGSNATPSAGPIPLASSNATPSAGPIPLASSSATTSDEPISLASSDPTTSDEPIPLASGSATTSDERIPLASSDPTTSAEPIPLASSHATTSDAPIPLAGSDADDDAPTLPRAPMPPPRSAPRPPAAVPLAASGAGAAAIPLASSAPPSTAIAIPLQGGDIPPGSTPAIPLAGSEDDPITEELAIPPSPKRTNGKSEAVALPAFLEALPEAGPAPAATQEFDDSATPGGEEVFTDAGDRADPVEEIARHDETVLFGDLPAPVDDEPLDDLPTPHMGDTDDLPVAAAREAASPATASGKPTPSDLPMAAKPSGPSDLPVAASGKPAGPSDLPTAAASAEAPSLMDDMPLASSDFATGALPASSDSVMAQITSSLPAAERVLPEAPKAAVGSGAVATMPVIAAADMPPKPKKPASRALLGALGGVGLLFVLSTLVLYVGPMVGFDLFADPEVQPPKKPVVKAEVKPPKPPEPKPAPTPVLAADNVDRLGFVELRAATLQHAALPGKADDPQHQGLLFWAWYRLAVLGDAEAQSELQNAPKPGPAVAGGPLLAAAALGAMAQSGKLVPARTVAEKLYKTRFKDETRLLLVAARTYTKPPELAKGLKAYDQLLAVAPGLEEAGLERAALALGKKDDAGAAAELVALVQKSKELPLALRAVERLLAAERFVEADELSLAWQLADADKLPAARRDAFLALVERRNCRTGAFEQARAAVEARLKLQPMPPAAPVEAVRLLRHLAPADAATLAETLHSQLTDPLAQAELLVERVRLHLAGPKPDLAAAQKDIDAASGLKQGSTAGYHKLAQALLAEQQGDVPAARKLYTQAGQGRPAFVEPQLGLLALAPGKPGPTVQKLTQLSKKSGSAAVDLVLAKNLAALGNHGGAAQLYDRVLWRDPAVDEPLGLLVHRIEQLSLAGAGERANALAAELQAARPKDEKVLALLVDIAERREDWPTAIRFRKLLVERQPDVVQNKILLAAALTSGGKGVEAEKLLTDLAKTKPDVKDAAYQLQLGRAWIDRDVVTARNLIHESIDKAPSAQSYAVLGLTESKAGRFEEAEAAYKKASQLDPTLVSIKLELAQMHMKKGDLDQAAVELRQVFAQNPRDAKAGEQLGDCLVDLNQPREAMSAYQAVSLLVGDDPRLLMKLAKVQLESLGLVQPGMKTLRRLIAADATHADAHYLLGLALKDLGKTGEALRELETYVKLAPQGELVGDAQRLIVDLEKE